MDARRTVFTDERAHTEPIATPVSLQDGELQVKSGRNMLRYVGRAAPNTVDGWLCTGDWVRMSGDRALFTGRRDSIVNIGGMNVFPEEVESFLHGLPGVVEGRVRAVSNPISGHLLVAEIVLMPGSDPEQERRTVLQSCRESLPRH